MAENIIRILSQPGIKRDGTRLEGDNYVDGEWVRFQRGLPRKMGGYRSINKYLRGVNRSLHEYTRDGVTFVHAGSAARVQRFFINGDYSTSIISDRTPASLAANQDTLWQFDVETTVAASGLQLLAHAAPNLSCICSSTEGQLFYGNAFGASALTEVTSFPAGYSRSGGVMALHPYTVLFGSDGAVMWSPDCADFLASGAGAAYVTGQKIVRGLAMRGGPGSSPSGLLWSADSVLRMTFIGGTAGFQFDTISAQSSIISSSSPIEYDGVYYWIGTDRFLMFNGVVREVENNINQNFFFDNLNYSQRQKVFAFKVPRFGEIWWCFPFGDSIEPNHAIIYNVRENSWYDTPLPEGGRAAALQPTVFPKPLATGVAPQNARLYSGGVDTGGSGYTVGDVLTLLGGTDVAPAKVTVASVSGGAITGVTVSDPGEYQSAPNNPVSVSGGAGTGGKITAAFDTPYQFWLHEVGRDKVDGLSTHPIRSFFETADISLPVQAGQNSGMRIELMEPDFVQSGPMTVAAHGRANARSPEVESAPLVITEVAATPQEQVIFMREQRRELRFRFESDVVGGNYEMGHILAHIAPGDGTVLG